MAINSLSKVLWDMAKRGDAFLLNTSKDTHVLVPYGKYCGTWTYIKSKRMCRWHFTFPADLADEKTQAYEIGGKSKTFPLPSTIYSFIGHQHPGKLHAANRKLLAWAVTRWACFNANKLRPFAELHSRLQEILKISAPSSKLGLRFALAFSASHTLAAAAKNSVQFKKNLDFLGQSGEFIRNLSPARRQRFVVRCLNLGPQFALKRVFRNCSEAKLAEVFKDNWKCDPSIAFSFLASTGFNKKLSDFQPLMYMAQGGFPRKISKIETHLLNEANNCGPTP